MRYSTQGTRMALLTTFVAFAACGESPTAPEAPVRAISFEGAKVIFATLTSVTPLTATVVAGGTQQYTATNSNGVAMVAPAVTWAASGGTINAAGLYTAGTTPGTFTVTATDASNGANIVVNVTVTAATGTGTGTVTCKLDDGKLECEKEHEGKDGKDGKRDDHKKAPKSGGNGHGG